MARSEGLEPPTFWLVVTDDPELTDADGEHSAEVYDLATGKRVA